MNKKECPALNCEAMIVRASYCSKHYKRVMRGQDPNFPTSKDVRAAIVEGDIAYLPLGVGAKDGYAIVDADNSGLDKYKWHVSNKDVKYAKTSTHDGDVFLHRMVMGVEGRGHSVIVDHINHDTTDNRRVNLRLCSNSQSMYNTAIKVTSKSSKFKGVSWHSSAKKWEVCFSVGGEKKYLGLFMDEVEAARAYDKAIKELRGEYAYTNENLGRFEKPPDDVSELEAED